MKKSRYNVLFEKNGSYYVYNTRSNAFASLEEDGYRLLKGDDKTDSVASLQEMMEMGFVVDDELDELQEVIVCNREERFASKTIGLVIAPTLACNLACPYCFESKKYGNMSEATKEKLIQFVREKVRCEKPECVSVTWYGGEPLVCYDVIRELSQKIMDICEEKGVRYEASIITNGVYLTSNIAYELVEKCNVKRAQITLDGTKNVHDKRRVAKDGKGSFGRIISNLKKTSRIIDCVIRINIDKENANDIERLLDELDEWGILKSVKIDFARIKGEGVSIFSPQEFADMETRLAKKLFAMGIGSAADFEPVFVTSSCVSTGRNYYVIDPDGYLYTCWNDIGVVEHAIGKLGEEMIYNKRYCEWLLMEYPEECKRCVYLPMCHGGCPYEIIHNKKIVCQGQILSLKSFLLMKAEAMEEFENEESAV